MAVKCHKFSSGANLDVVQSGGRGGEDREKGESNHYNITFFTINVTIALAR